MIVSLNPFRTYQQIGWNLHEPYVYFAWFYAVNYTILLLNLLPIFPLDGGQLLQSVLWAEIGHYPRSMMVATVVGMIGSVIMGILSLAVGVVFTAMLFVVHVRLSMATSNDPA